MRLIDLRIRYIDYGERNNTYAGVAKFSSEIGEIQLNLTHDHCQQIFKVCADSVVQVSREVANHLTADVIDGQNLFPKA